MSGFVHSILTSMSPRVRSRSGRRTGPARPPAKARPGRAIPFVFPCPVLSLLVISAAILPGCKMGSDSIIERDSDVSWPEVRLSWQFFPEREGTLRSIVSTEADGVADQAPPKRFPGGEPAPGSDAWENAILAADLEGTQIRGEFTHRIGRNDLEFGGKVFDPNQVVDVDYRVGRISALCRGGKRWLDMFSVEGLSGIGYQVLDLTVEERGPAPQEENESFNSILVYLGARLSFRPVRFFSIYGQAGYGYLSLVGTHGDAEIGARIEPLPGIALYAGWRYWREYIYVGPVAEYVVLTFAGTVVGVHITF